MNETAPFERAEAARPFMESCQISDITIIMDDTKNLAK